MDKEIEHSVFEGVLTIIFEVAAIMTKKRKGKSKRVKASSPDQIDKTVDAPSADKPESDENLIYVGGNALYHEVKENGKYPTKSFKEFREQANLSLLSEKKSRRKKKGKRPGAEPMDDRSQKIRNLKNDDSIWKGLE